MLPERLDGLVIEITENELVSGDAAMLRRARRPARARRAAGRRRHGRRLRRPDPRDAPAAGHHQARPRAHHRRRPDPAKAPLISSFVRYARDIDADRLRRGRRDAAPSSSASPTSTSPTARATASPAPPRRGPPVARRGDRRLPALLRGRPRWTATDAPAPRRPRPPARAARRGGSPPPRRRPSWRPACSRSRDELQADEVRLVAGRGRRVGDPAARRRPDADPFEAAGAARCAASRSCLALPITHGGETSATSRPTPRRAPVEPLPDRPRPHDRLPARAAPRHTTVATAP